MDGGWSLQDYTDVSQVVLTAFTVVGVVASLLISARALREVQIDRALRQAPFLAFVTGGTRRHVEFVRAGSAIPGIDPKAAARAFPNLPPNAESVRLAGPAPECFYGRLVNLGAGPALGTRVVWIVDAVQIGHDRFELTDAKRMEPLYSEGLNTLPAVPGHIRPGEEAQLTRIPTFIEKDINKQILRVEGRLRILCADVAGQANTFEQSFRVFTGYTEQPPWFHVTFSQLLGPTDDTSAPDAAS